MTSLLVQRIGIDLDDEHGDEAGDGAALIDLATLVRSINLPFSPFPDLRIKIGDTLLTVEQIVWDCADGRITCHAYPIWTQTRKGAQSIVETLVAAGFRPLDTHHRDAH